MVRFVTGPINSGKTTAVRRMYEKERRGDGFVALKNMDGTRVIDFHAMRLSTGETRVLMVRETDCPDERDVADVIGPYHMLNDTKIWIENTIQSLIDERVEPIFFDEIGLLETRGEGFSDLLSEVLSHDLDMVLSVRDSLLSAIIDRYHIKTYEIIRRGERYGLTD
jgi:nucleoside-triphosphatase THEP1